MIDKWVVTIKSEDKNGREGEYIAEHTSFNNAIRDIYTFRKRGHEMYEYKIQKERRLM